MSHSLSASPMISLSFRSEPTAKVARASAVQTQLEYEQALITFSPTRLKSFRLHSYTAPSIPQLTRCESSGDHAMERTLLLWPRKLPMLSHVLVEYTCTVFPFTAANRWPPCEKRHSLHARMASSLYGRMSSISRFISRSLSEKPTRTERPDGWKASECASSENVRSSSIVRSR